MDQSPYLRITINLTSFPLSHLFFVSSSSFSLSSYLYCHHLSLSTSVIYHCFCPFSLSLPCGTDNFLPSIISTVLITYRIPSISSFLQINDDGGSVLPHNTTIRMRSFRITSRSQIVPSLTYRGTVSPPPIVLLLWCAFVLCKLP